METDRSVAQKRFAVFAWVVLAYNIPVILWGAYVRASYSGDGCGANWPFCNGQAVPQHMSKPTIIEYTHRMMTSLDGMLVIALLALAFWIYPKRHIIRRYAVASLGFLLVEALLGAGLVLLRQVAHDQSVGRVWSLSAHQANTLALLATMTLTAWLASNGLEQFRIREARAGLLWSAVVTIVVAITGSVTALGDMLFPSNSLMAGVQRDLSSESPLLLRLRVAHPAIAIAGAAFAIWMALAFLRDIRLDSGRKAAMRVIGLFTLQLFVGAANLTLLAPLWMQLIHLLMADLVWIAVVLVVAESARPVVVVREDRVKERRTVRV
jgi:cytochrome c oxidase assembly protein subunit 15